MLLFLEIFSTFQGYAHLFSDTTFGYASEPDYEWLMIDASHIKVHPYATGAVGGNQRYEPNKRGPNTKLHVAMDALVCHSERLL